MRGWVVPLIGGAVVFLLAFDGVHLFAAGSGVLGVLTVFGLRRLLRPRPVRSN